MSIPKDFINKDNKLTNKDLDFLEKIKPDDTVRKEPDAEGTPSITEVDLENSKIIEKDQNPEEEILLAGAFPKNWKPKKKTYQDKNAEDLTNEELGIQQQEQLKTKAEGEDFVFEEGTGKAVFSDFSDEQLESINKTLEKFAAGELADTGDRSLKFIFDELDKDIKNSKLLDSQKFSDAMISLIPKGSKITIKDLMDEAASLNRNDVYLKLLKLKDGETLDLPTMARGVMEAKLLYVKLQDIAVRASKGDFTELDKQQFYQMYRLFSMVYAKSAGDLSARAQGMRVVQSLDKPTKEGAEDIIKLLTDEIGADFSDQGFQQFTQAFSILKPYQAGKMAQASYGKKLRDAWAEIWVNSLLSSPITHAVNIVGNTTFNTLRIAEYAIAAGINKVPGLGGPDGIAFSEVMAMVRSFRTGFRLGLENSYKSIKTGEAQTTKLDLRKPNAFGKELLPEGLQNGPMGSFLQLLGTINRIPGTALVAEDEFMKGIMYRMELERLAQRNYNEHLRLKPDDYAGAEKIFLETVNNPNNATVAAAKESMLEGTFQKDLPPGILKEIQSIMNIPEIKLFVPFYKTITNIFLESGKRNPILMAPFIATNPKLKADFLGKNGKAAQQLMLAKLATGSSLLMGFGMYAYGANSSGGDFMITGMAPYTKTERDAFFRQGLQPYSLCEKTSGNTYSCTSYARFDPVSSLLAISADTAYLLSRPDQYGDPTYDERMVTIATAAIGAIFMYMTEQPFLSGMKDMSKIFSPGAFNPEKGMSSRAFEFLTEKVTEGGMSLVPGVSSFGRYLTRMSDQSVYEYAITESQDAWFKEFFDIEGDVPLAVRGFYKAYNKAMYTSPFFNTDLEKKLNFWGEPIEGPEFNMFSPIRVKNTKYKKVDEMLVKLGFGISMPRAYIDGVPMNQNEYNQYIRLINMDANNNGESDVLEQLNTLVLSAEFIDLAITDADAAMQQIQSIVNEAKATARDEFLRTNEKFNSRVTEVNNLKKDRVNKRLKNK